ncbi:MAG TPA: thioredoxin domain-containing protein [Caulobacteraceae bacterium]|jgi:protein-disulfide isomerase
MRALIALAAALAVLGLAACQKPSGQAAPDDMTLGNPKAPVTMIEYASVACPHCARFNNEVFPAFKAKYVDTGQVFYVAREALTADPAIAAAGFLTARCAGKDKYFQVVDAIYHSQAPLETGGDPHAMLLQIARSAGLTDAQFEACIRDPNAIKALNDRWDRYVNDDKISGTPTFVINGKVYAKGEMSMADLDAAVAQAKSGATQAKPAT